MIKLYKMLKLIKNKIKRDVYYNIKSQIKRREYKEAEKGILKIMSNEK